jgi:hypothetical protein
MRGYFLSPHPPIPIPFNPLRSCAGRFGAVKQKAATVPGYNLS